MHKNSGMKIGTKFVLPSQALSSKQIWPFPGQRRALPGTGSEASFEPYTPVHFVCCVLKKQKSLLKLSESSVTSRLDCHFTQFSDVIV